MNGQICIVIYNFKSTRVDPARLPTRRACELLEECLLSVCDSFGDSIYIFSYMMSLLTGFSIKSGGWLNSPAISRELAAYFSLKLPQFKYSIHVLSPEK